MRAHPRKKSVPLLLLDLLLLALAAGAVIGLAVLVWSLV